jgi:hypothetical protein
MLQAEEHQHKHQAVLVEVRDTSHLKILLNLLPKERCQSTLLGSPTTDTWVMESMVLVKSRFQMAEFSSTRERVKRRLVKNH